MLDTNYVIEDLIVLIAIDFELKKFFESEKKY